MHKRPINFGSSIGKPKHKPNVANPKIIAPIEVIVRYTSIYDVTWASNGWLMRCFMASGFSHCYSSIIGMIIYYPFLLTLIMFNPYIYTIIIHCFYTVCHYGIGSTMVYHVKLPRFGTLWYCLYGVPHLAMLCRFTVVRFTRWRSSRDGAQRLTNRRARRTGLTNPYR